MERRKLVPDGSPDRMLLLRVVDARGRVSFPVLESETGDRITAGPVRPIPETRMVRIERHQVALEAWGAAPFRRGPGGFSPQRAQSSPETPFESEPQRASSSRALPRDAWSGPAPEIRGPGRRVLVGHAPGLFFSPPGGKNPFVNSLAYLVVVNIAIWLGLSACLRRLDRRTSSNQRTLPPQAGRS